MSKLKLIFIDIDGVLNNMDDETSYFTYDPSKYTLSKTNIDALRKVLDQTGAKLVLSTSWRNHDKDYAFNYHGKLFKSPLKKFIEEIGKEHFYEHDSAPHLSGYQKYCDILGFFYKYDLDIQNVKFAVLDDQMNQLLEKFGDSFFFIDGQHGLTSGIADSVIIHLNKEKRQ